MRIIGNKPGFDYPHKKQTMVYSSGVDISSPWLVQLQELDGDATEMFPLAENGEDPAAALQRKKKKHGRKQDEFLQNPRAWVFHQPNWWFHDFSWNLMGISWGYHENPMIFRLVFSGKTGRQSKPKIDRKVGHLER